MYAAGLGIKTWRATRAGGYCWPRLTVLVTSAVLAASLGLAFGACAHAGPASAGTTVIVQPGDTLWSIAATHYPADDVRVRVQDIEQANGLRGPQIEVGQTLRLPG